MAYGDGIGRREFVRGGAGLVLGSSLLTAGCGVGQETGSEEAVKKVVPAKVDGDLLIFNWTEYMDPKLVTSFEDRYKVKVRTSNFDSMPSMMAKLRSGNEYDLIFPTADYVNRLVQANMLLEVDREKLRNAGTVYSFFDDPWYDAKSAHTVPYAMYTTGIAWRDDKVDGITGSWNDLMNESAKGKVFMLDDFQEGIGQANLLNGFDLNATGEEELEQTKATLEQQKEFLRGYSTNAAPQLAERRRVGPPRLERRHHQHPQPGEEEPRDLPVRDLQGGHPGRLGLHGDPRQRQVPRHGAAVHGLDPRSDQRLPEHQVPRLPDADRGLRGRLRRARGGRPRDRGVGGGPGERKPVQGAHPRGAQGLGPSVDGGQGVNDAFWRRFLVPGALWLAFFFAVPFGIAIAISLGQASEFGGVIYGWHPENYADALDPLFAPILLRSVGYAAATALLCLAIGYPVAYTIARYGGRWKNALIALVLLPFLINYLVRTYAWVALLSDEGLLSKHRRRAARGHQHADRRDRRPRLWLPRAS